MESKRVDYPAGTKPRICSQHGACAGSIQAPYDEDYPVVCMDESPKQLIEEVASTPIRPGQEARLDYAYIRHGLVNIFMANEPPRLSTRHFSRKKPNGYGTDLSLFYPQARELAKYFELYRRSIRFTYTFWYLLQISFVYAE